MGVSERERDGVTEDNNEREIKKIV